MNAETLTPPNPPASLPPSSAAAPRWPLLNVWADDLSMPELMAHLDKHGGMVFTINPDHLFHLQHNADFLDAYRQADLITVDSHYVRFSMCAMGRPVRNRLPGSDIVPAYLAHHAQRTDTRVFLLGAKPGVAQRALENINRRVGRELVVGAHGPSMRFGTDPHELDQVLELIRASGANTMFVGLGAPKEEIWLAQVRKQLPQVRVMMGIGAVIDYEAGEVKRAPPIWRRIGMEWLYRVLTEPGRYLRRYVRNSRFFWHALLDGLGRYRDPLSGTPRQKR